MSRTILFPPRILPGLIAQVHQSLSGLCGAAPYPGCRSPEACRESQTLGAGGLYRLSRGRKEVQVVEAAPGHASRSDSGTVPREMEPAARIPDGRARLRRATCRVRQEDRPWPQAQGTRRGTCPEGTPFAQEGSLASNLRRQVAPETCLPVFARCTTFLTQTGRPARLCSARACRRQAEDNADANALRCREPRLRPSFSRPTAAGRSLRIEFQYGKASAAFPLAKAKTRNRPRAGLTNCRNQSAMHT